MRSQAIVLAALAALLPVPALAQPAPASPGPATTQAGSHGASDTDDAEQGGSDDDDASASPAAPTGKKATQEAADDSADSDEDETPDVGSVLPLIPPAVDTLGGHFDLSGSAGVAVPFGELQQNTSVSSKMGVGWGFGAELGYGVSRSVVVGVWGQALRLGSSSSCSACSTTSLAIGPFVQYHLVQGTRFDPWMSAGLGFRTTKITGAPQGDLSYSGLEWLRLRVGGDWYAFSKFGFGPFLELDAGHYLSTPSQITGGASAHLAFTAGLRLIVDLPGK